ncbi:MAG: hypothetical protein WA647_19050 [Candidatus Acidiferrum sp.]
MARKSVLAVRLATKSSESNLNYQIDAIPAYRCGRSRLLNTEKALRAAAFLLEWSSDVGNEPLDGSLASGISRVLDQAAAEVAHMRVWITNEFLGPQRPLRKSGGAA